MKSFKLCVALFGVMCMALVADLLVHAQSATDANVAAVSSGTKGLLTLLGMIPVVSTS